MRQLTLLQRLIDRAYPGKRFLASAAAIVGIGAGLNSLGAFGGGGGGPNPSQYIYYNPWQQSQASTQWFGDQNTASTNVGDFSGVTRSPIMTGLNRALATDTSGIESLIP